LKYLTLILDGHNLFYRSWNEHISDCLLDNKAIYNSGIEKFIKRVSELKAEFGYIESEIYFLFDNPESVVKMRKEIDENYKSHRLNSKYKEEINRSINYLKEVLRNYFDNAFIFNIDYCESDDLVPAVLKICKKDALVISADLDWARNIEKNIHWYNFKKIYTLDEFKNDFGFYPNGNKIKWYKAFKGDHSDNISNAVPYLPKNILLHIIEDYSEIPVDKIIGCILKDNTISQEWKIKIKSAEIRIKQNYTLVDFFDINEKIEDHIQICKRNKTLASVWFKILNLDLMPWMLDKNKPSDFLMPETYRKIRSRKKK